MFYAAVAQIGKANALASKTNNDGTYRAYLARVASGYYYYDYIAATIVDQFYPTYMNPVRASKGGTPPGPYQINFNLKAYRGTNTISGHVLIGKDTSWQPLDNIEVDVSGSLGGTYTKTYSDGHYVAYVSDSMAQYSVQVSPNYIVPSGYVLTEGTVIKGPGSYKCKFPYHRYNGSRRTALTKGFFIS